MANRKKRPEQTYSVAIQVRVTAETKRELDEMSEATGVPISERIRKHIEADIEKWHKQK